MPIGHHSNLELALEGPAPQEMDDGPDAQGAGVFGVTNADLLGLANANFSLFDFEGGGGNYLLDFSGIMQRDATVDIKVAASNIKIIVPAGVPATINIEGSLNNVNVNGSWVMEGTSYTQPGEGPGLVFNIDMGVGILTLDN